MILRNLRSPFKAHLFSAAARLCFVDGDEGAAEAGAGSGEVDLRGELAAAFDAFESSDAGGGAAAPVTAAKPGNGPATAPAATQQPGETAEQAAQRARDAKTGQFAKEPKPAQAAQQKTETQTPQGAGEPGQAQTIAPPPSWSAAAKAKFAALDPEVQQEVLKRERDIEQGKAQWQQGAERLNRLDAILAPRREQFALAGLDDVRAVQTLFAAQDYLQRDPAGALIYLGRQAGVNWQQLFQQLSGAQPQGQQPQRQQLDPRLDPLTRQVQTLTQTVSQQQEQQRAAVAQQYQDQVQQFAADPKNLYFENVKTRMGNLIRTGLAKDLPDAYEQACLSDPAVRPLMLASIQQQQTDAARAAAAAKVGQARQASGSITGSPSPGASPNGAASKGNVREDLSAAWDAHA